MKSSDTSLDAILKALERQGGALRAQGAVLAGIGAGIREQSANIRELPRDRIAILERYGLENRRSL